MTYFCPEQSFLLGVGSDGTAVFLGVVEDGSEVAVKKILKGDCEDTAKNEILKSLVNKNKSPFIVNYRNFVEDDISMYLIVDLCEETLHEHVDSYTNEHLREHGPRIYQRNLVWS